GMRYDSDSLVIVREHLYNLGRRIGYYDFVRQYIRFEVDSNKAGNFVDLKLIIDNPENKTEHTVYRIDSSFVEIATSADSTIADPAVDTLRRGMHYTDHSKKFRPQPIGRYIFLKKGNIYNIDSENLTYDRLYELNAFKSIKVNFEKSDSTRLNAFYELVPLKRMANRIEGEYTFNSGRSGFNIGNTYTNRNLFGGAEQLELK